MAPLGLLDLMLLFIVASYSNGEQWGIKVKSTIWTTQGENLTIPCTFTYPNKSQENDVQVYWKKPGRSLIKTKDHDMNTFVFHPNDDYVITQYRGKTRLFGNPKDGNCSLKIQNVQNSDHIYVRVAVNGVHYSFNKNMVRIFLKDVNSAFSSLEPTNVPMATTSDYQMQGKLSTPGLFAAIFTPLLMLAIVAVVIGVLFYMKRKKSQITRGQSGYYGNVSRATLDKDNRETPCQSNDNKTLSKIKSIDEPIYVNTQNVKNDDDETMDQTTNIYANF